MWLSKQAAQHPDTTSGGKLGIVTIGGSESAVASGSEIRHVPVASPGGIVWFPERDREVITLTCDNGTTVVLGVVGNVAPIGLEPGDVYLYAGQAAILLKKNGDIILEGNVSVKGSLAVENEGGRKYGTEAG